MCLSDSGTVCMYTCLTLILHVYSCQDTGTACTFARLFDSDTVCMPVDSDTQFTCIPV